MLKGAKTEIMFKRIFTMALFAALLSLIGCDPQRIAELEEGVSTEADVRSKFGEPEKIWEGLQDGKSVKIFEYNRQPAGHRNYMISIGADGKMAALRQVLNQVNFAKVTPGMVMEDVRKMLGKPMKVTPYALSQTTHYDWRYLNPPTTAMIFSVVFDRDLRVVSTGSVIEELTAEKSRN